MAAFENNAAVFLYEAKFKIELVSLCLGLLCFDLQRSLEPILNSSKLTQFEFHSKMQCDKIVLLQTQICVSFAW